MTWRDGQLVDASITASRDGDLKVKQPTSGNWSRKSDGPDTFKMRKGEALIFHISTPDKQISREAEAAK